jgi:arginyl-tRNA synthetase
MKKIIAKLLKEALSKEAIKIDEEKIISLLEAPPSPDMGDYAFPVFFLAPQLKMPPKDIALKVRQNIPSHPPEIESIETIGGYINFYVNRVALAENLVKKILKENKNYGSFELEKLEKVMVEFSQPNTHKAFHVGHIRGTSLGESLARIFEFAGNQVVRANYSGDTGMHIAKWIWCYQKHHKKSKLKNDESWIASIYVDAVKRLAKDKKGNLKAEVEEINRKLEEKTDKKLNSLWEKTRQLSIDSWKKIYQELNTRFDVHFFESEMESYGKEIVIKLLKSKIAKNSEGAVIMDLNDYNLGVWVLLRKDGTVLYSAKDLALAEIKFKELKIDKSIYITASEQDLHFRQLFKTLELMNFKPLYKMLHVSYSLVRLPHGKMSSRTGDNILYSDFMDEMKKYAKKEIKKRFPKIPKKELDERALKISVAAIKYSMLRQGANRVIVFNKKEALNFDGDSGPYILYSYARATSILKKSKTKERNISVRELEPKEIELVKKLSEFPAIVLNAYKNLSPSLIANYSYQLAQIFNEFYHSCPVINQPNEAFRLTLVESFRIVLKNALWLLGIDVLEEM